MLLGWAADGCKNSTDAVQYGCGSYHGSLADPKVLAPRRLQLVATYHILLLDLYQVAIMTCHQS